MVRKSGKENQTEKPVTLTVPNSECKSQTSRLDRMQRSQFIFYSTKQPPFESSFITNMYLS